LTWLNIKWGRGHSWIQSLQNGKQSLLDVRKILEGHIGGAGGYTVVIIGIVCIGIRVAGIGIGIASIGVGVAGIGIGIASIGVGVAGIGIVVVGNEIIGSCASSGVIWDQFESGNRERRGTTGKSLRIHDATTKFGWVVYAWTSACTNSLSKGESI